MRQNERQNQIQKEMPAERTKGRKGQTGIMNEQPSNASLRQKPPCIVIQKETSLSRHLRNPVKAIARRVCRISASGKM
jgi:hypothetical protein